MRHLINTINETDFQGVSVIKLAQQDSYEILLITLEKGAEIPAHVANRNANLIMLQGHIRFHIENKEYTLMANTVLCFEKNIQHWVKAEENSKFVLIK